MLELSQAFTEFVTEQVQNIGTAACPPCSAPLKFDRMRIEGFDRVRTFRHCDETPFRMKKGPETHRCGVALDTVQ